MKNVKFLFLFFFLIFPLVVFSEIKVDADKAEGRIVTLSASNFKNEIAKGLVMVDFWAPWCAPCRKLEPILKEVVSTTGVKLGKLNVDTYKNLAIQSNVSRLPTIILYKDGREVKRLVGLYSKEEIIEIIKSYK